MLEEDDLGPADEALLDLLRKGRITAPYAAEEADYSLQYVRDCLNRMVEHGNVEKIYEGLYELAHDPRESEDESGDSGEEGSEGNDIAESDLSEADAEPVTNDGQTDVDAKRETYEELESEQDSIEENTDSTNVDPRVQEIVDDVAAGWDDDERLQHRKQAAAEVLQHAVDTDEAVGKSSDIVQHVREKYPVADQNDETYWRQNIRDVLSEVGTYSRGSHKYTVTDFDQEGEADE